MKNILNELLKAHLKIDDQRRMIKSQNATIRELKATVAHLQAGLKGQAAESPKVNNQPKNKRQPPDQGSLRPGAEG